MTSSAPLSAAPTLLPGFAGTELPEWLPPRPRARPRGGGVFPRENAPPGRGGGGPPARRAGSPSGSSVPAKPGRRVGAADRGAELVIP